MPKGIFYVESKPSAPERETQYNEWYDTVHLPEVCRVEGIVSARRFAPVTDGGPYVALYEIEADDLTQVVQALLAVAGSGGFRMSDALETDPRPVTRLLRLVAEHDPPPRPAGTAGARDTRPRVRREPIEQMEATLWLS
jgi:REV protein (anti-repression trans-activator protein)